MSEETASFVAEPHPDESCNIKVICRVRPLNQREENEGSKFILKFPTEESIAIGGKAFVYDKVLQPSSTQSFVYETIAKPIVADVLSGYNGTIFAYGQTCSGKTHTMEGVMGNDELQGIIPRIISDIFSYIYKMDENLEFHIKISYYEIYMEKIRDLLDVTKTNLAVHEDRNRVPYVKGATERFVSCPEEVLDAIVEGKSNRQVAVTNMNEHSSRSHSVFLINVKQENTATQKKLSGKLYLVDLAGSEKVSKTGAEGAVLDEAKNINKSLSSLGNVISNLAEGSSHIPYRDSKLTRILQESLGGNARTTMIICCSPASYNDSETKSTLMFGQRAKTIKNTVIVNVELTADEWKRRYEKERDRSSRLKVTIGRFETELNRWRQGDSVPDSEQTIPSSASMLNLASSGTPSQKDSSRNPSTSELTSATNKDSNAIENGVISSAAEIGDWEMEKQSLFLQLDDKDDEIYTQSQLVEKLKEQMQAHEVLMVVNVKENENLNSEINRIQLDLESSKKEVKDVIQALEELAANYDYKTSEIENITIQNNALNRQMKNNVVKITSLEFEINEQKILQIDIRKRIGDMMISLMNDINELGSAFQDNINADFKVPVLSSDGLEEEFMASREFVSKAKSEIKNFISRSLILEQKNQDCERKLSSTTGELSECKLQLQQHMIKISSLQETHKQMESEKDRLEQSIDKLTDQCATAMAQEQLMDKEKNNENLLLSSLEQQMQEHREQHHKQLTGLRSELSEKQEHLDTLNEEKQKLKLLLDNLQVEYDKLKIDEQIKSDKLSEMLLNAERPEKDKYDYFGFGDRVNKKINSLYNLRKSFIRDLHVTLRKGNAGKDDKEEELSLMAQKQKNDFLESNLDQLTRVHKQLVKDNSDLRCELPRLEKRLRATVDRVKSLEMALTEAKESAMKDRDRYQQEVNRIKEAIKQKAMLRRSANSASIIKPIRAGVNPAQVCQSTSIRGGGAAKVI